MRDFNLRQLDLNLLVTLHVVIEQGNVSRAAARLGRSQSAVSHALQRLRAHFDDPLLVRRGSEMAPTPRAMELEGRLRHILADVEQLIGPSDFDPKNAQGTLRIATTDYGLAVVVPHVLAKLAEEAPHLSISCSAVSEHMFDHLKSRFLDLALSGQESFGEMETETLFTERFVVVTRSDHPLVGRTMTVDDFIAWPHAILDVLHSRHFAIDGKLERMGKRRRIVLRMPHLLAAPFFAQSADLLVPVPERIASLYVETLGLVPHQFPRELDLGRFDYVQVWHERRTNEPLHRWLRGLVREAASNIREAAPSLSVR